MSWYNLTLSPLEYDAYRRRRDPRITGARIDRWEDGGSDVYSFLQFAHQAEASWMLDHMLFRDGLTFLAAPAFAGKTFLAVDIAAHIASGANIWHHDWEIPDAPLNVAYIINESRQYFWERIHAAAYHHSLDYDTLAEHLFILPTTFNLFTNPEQEGTSLYRLARSLDKIEPDLIIFDIFARMIRGQNENAQEDMTHAIGMIETIQDHHDAAALVLHHTNKQGLMRGSTILTDLPDHVVTLTPDKDNSKQVEMRWDKHRGGDTPTNTWFEIISDGATGYLEPASRTQNLPDETLQAIKTINNKIYCKKDDLTAIWKAPSTRYRKIAALKKHGYITEDDSGTLLLTEQAYQLLEPSH